MEILYVILGIILIIAIMAFTGYYLEKKQKNVVESENNINIIFDGVNEHKNVNAATNADIPDVLNFNEIEEYENKKEQSNVEPIQFDIENNIDNGNNNDDVNVIQFDEPVKLDNEQVQEEVPAVLDLTESSVEITNPVSEEIPAVLDLTDSSISEETVENNDVIEVTEQVQDEPEIPEVVNEPVQEDVVPVEEPVKKNKKTKGKSKKNAVSDDEVRQDIVIDSDSITIPDDF